ncbi:hypothetical protein M885DRAFT_514350 [Pelagophyceae sp. CCMP2097]|nr:hypothetical protein M885DRAFT_514350 [Pelagophyceae sp. CCMP2097]
MGIDTDLFVHAVSKQLICPVCQGVVEDPVTTPCDHLFCEACLLEWLERRASGQESCPVCVRVIDVARVRPPTRVLVNLLGELERRCAHAGCAWAGASDRHGDHLRQCDKHAIDVLRREHAAKDDTLRQLRRTVARLENVELENQALRAQLDRCRAGGDSGASDLGGRKPATDVQRIKDLLRAQQRLEF